jgi:hypothetical protein
MRLFTHKGPRKILLQHQLRAHLWALCGLLLTPLLAPL